MSADLVLGIDCSTTASKAVAWDATGEPVAEARHSLELLSPKPGWGEQSAEDWWAATVAAIRGVVTAIPAERIAAVCITHQRETFVPVMADGRPLRNGILWLDERSRTQLGELDRRFGADALHQLTGRPLSMTQSLPKLLWLVEHEPATVLDADLIVEVAGYLGFRLTGQWHTSLSSADPMGIVDLAKGVWAEDIITGIGLSPRQFIPFSPPGSVIGEVSDQAAAETGLQRGTLLVAGAGDGQAASLGAGVTGPGVSFANIGTAIAGGVVSDRYLADLAFRTCSGAVPGTFVFESVLRGGTATVTWFMDHIADPTIAGDRFDHYEALAAGLPPGAEGLMLVPYWNTVMNPYWDAAASGMVLGWTVAHRRHHLYRAILEGIALEHRVAMDAIVAASAEPVSRHVVLGGGARSPLWRQIICDVLGEPVSLARSADATNLGAGILAAAAAGLHPTIHEAAAAMTALTATHEAEPIARDAYSTLYHEVYRGLFPAIRPLMDRLTEIAGHP